MPEDVHDAVRRRAEEEGLTLRAYLLAVIERDLALPSRAAWLRELATLEPVTGIDASRAVREAREERDHELAGRLRR